MIVYLWQLRQNTISHDLLVGHVMPSMSKPIFALTFVLGAQFYRLFSKIEFRAPDHVWDYVPYIKPRYISDMLTCSPTSVLMIGDLAVFLTSQSRIHPRHAALFTYTPCDLGYPSRIFMTCWTRYTHPSGAPGLNVLSWVRFVLCLACTQSL